MSDVTTPTASLHESLTSPPPGHLWYFAYGSNMCATVMKRRKFTPKHTVAASLPNHRLVFGLPGFPYAEPAFATVFRRTEECVPGPDAHGACHLITEEEYRLIRWTEGGNGHEGIGYRDMEVEVVTVSGATFKARTLTSPKCETRENLWPSKRYLGLCVTGARECGLPEEYITWLAEHRHYDYTKMALSHRIASGIFIFVSFPVISIAIATMLMATKFKIRPPWIFAFLFSRWNRIVSWHGHELLLRPLFGSGYNQMALEKRAPQKDLP